MPRLRRRLVAIAVLSLLAISACSNDFLPTLLADPMADYQPPGTELIEEKTQPERGEPFRRLAHVIRTFRILKPDEADAVLAAATAEAEAAGWWIEEGENACKNLGPGVGSLVIILQDRTPEMRLHISLHYDRGHTVGDQAYPPTCPLLNS